MTLLDLSTRLRDAISSTEDDINLLVEVVKRLPDPGAVLETQQIAARLAGLPPPPPPSPATIPMDWMVSLPPECSNPSAMIAVGAHVYVLNYTDSSLVRIAIADPSDMTVLRFPPTGEYYNASGCVYAPSQHRIYIVFQPDVVAFVDPDTLEWQRVPSDNFQAAWGVAADLESLYLFDMPTLNNYVLRRYTLDHWKSNGQVRNLYPAGRGMAIDGESLFIIGSLEPSWIAKIDLASFSLSGIRLLENPRMDYAGSIALTDQHVWVGSQRSGVVRLNKTDLGGDVLYTDVGVSAVGSAGSAVFSLAPPNRLIRVDTGAERTFADTLGTPAGMTFSGEQAFFAFGNPVKAAACRLTEIA